MRAIRPHAAAGPRSRLVRRVLLAATDQETRALLDEVTDLLQQAKAQTQEQLWLLRKQYNLALPDLTLEWDLVPTATATPTQTLQAFAGRPQAEVRVTVHLDGLSDDTTEPALQAVGIEYLIGLAVTAAASPGRWQHGETGGMMAVIEAPVTALGNVLRDIALDIAMAHARSQPWTGVRQHLSPALLGALKVRFAQERRLLAGFPYGDASEAGYLPLAALARRNGSASKAHGAELDGQRYATLWQDFWAFVREHALAVLPGELISRAEIAYNLRATHVHGEQISLKKLAQAVAALEPGHYYFYFLLHRVRQLKRFKRVNELFRTPHQTGLQTMRTQRWVIHPAGQHQKEFAQLLREGYINVVSVSING